MKYTDNEIREYDELNELIKALTKKRDAMKDRFIQSNGGESESYLVTLKDNFRETVASKAEFEKRFGSEWLKDNGLLKLSAFSTVTISVKTSAERVG